MQIHDWQPLTTSKFLAASIALAALFLLLMTDEDGFLIFLDHANLAFHEAGHLFFGILGSTLGLYGGTLGQLVFPVAVTFSFWKQGKPVGCAFGAVWFFQNFLNIARYLADARAQQLPLVGGGEHDWTNILGRWGVLAYDMKIAAVISAIGWLGMLAAWLWLANRWRQDSDR